jgi:hypothetical protein
MEEHMKTLVKFSVVAATALLAFLAADKPPQTSQPLPGFQLIAEAHAVAGRARRTRRRGMAVGYAAGQEAAYDEMAATTTTTTTSAPLPTAAPQQVAPAPQTAAPAPQSSAPAPQQAAPAAAPTGARPLGSVVQQLPDGCSPNVVGGVEYQHCGNDYYRAVFQGDSLVYVTADPGQ